MLEPNAGQAVVVDDDWQKGGQLEVDRCLKDGQVVTIGNLLDDGSSQTVDPAITLGLPLEIRQGDKRLSLDWQEVAGMSLGAEGSEVQLLPPSRASHSTKSIKDSSTTQSSHTTRHSHEISFEVPSWPNDDDLQDGFDSIFNRDR